MQDPTHDAHLTHRMRSDVLWLTGSVAVSALLRFAFPSSFLAFIPLGITLPAAVLLSIHALKRL